MIRIARLCACFPRWAQVLDAEACALADRSPRTPPAHLIDIDGLASRTPSVASVSDSRPSRSPLVLDHDDAHGHRAPSGPASVVGASSPNNFARRSMMRTAAITPARRPCRYPAPRALQPVQPPRFKVTQALGLLLHHGVQASQLLLHVEIRGFLRHLQRRPMARYVYPAARNWSACSVRSRLAASSPDGALAMVLPARGRGGHGLPCNVLPVADVRLRVRHG